MILELDQSGKLENTATPTAVAVASRKGERLSVLITAAEKKKLQRMFRELGKPRLYIYRTFAALAFLVIEPVVKKLDRLVIDTEYPGHDDLIKQFILESTNRQRKKMSKSTITFSQIGKASPAHVHAYAVYKRKVQPTRKVTAKDVLRLIIV